MIYRLIPRCMGTAYLGRRGGGAHAQWQIFCPFCPNHKSMPEPIPALKPGEGGGGGLVHSSVARALKLSILFQYRDYGPWEHEILQLNTKEEKKGGGGGSRQNFTRFRQWFCPNFVRFLPDFCSQFARIITFRSFCWGHSASCPPPPRPIRLWFV